MYTLHGHVIHVIKDISKLAINVAKSQRCSLDFTERCNVYLDKQRDVGIQRRFYLFLSTQRTSTRREGRVPVIVMYNVAGMT